MQNKSVEHLDLELQLSADVLPEFKRALDEFMHNFHYQVIAPKWMGDTLLINSKDFVELSGYIKKENLRDIDLARVKKLAEKQMKIWLQKSMQPGIRYHYNWCLTALNSFDWGRHH